MPTQLLAGVLCVIVAALASGQHAGAQIFKKLGKTVTEAAGSGLVSQTNRLVWEPVRCGFTDLKCIARAEQQGRQVVLTDSAGRPVPAAEQRAAPGAAPTASPEISFRRSSRRRPNRPPGARSRFTRLGRPSFSSRWFRRRATEGCHRAG